VRPFVSVQKQVVLVPMPVGIVLQWIIGWGGS
jgi:hypothetical protein